MTDFGLIIGVVGVELAVGYRYTSRAYAARSIVEKDFGQGVRDAVLASEASKLTPALADLFEMADRIRTQRPWIDQEEDPLDSAAEIEERRRRIKNLLSRGDMAPQVRAVAKAGRSSREPPEAKDRFARRWRRVFWPLAATHVLAPVVLFDELVDKDVLPKWATIAAGAVSGVAVVAAVILGLIAANASSSLSSAIAEGKDGDGE